MSFAGCDPLLLDSQDVVKFHLCTSNSIDLKGRDCLQLLCRPSYAHPSCLTYQSGVHMSTITCSSIVPGISKRVLISTITYSSIVHGISGGCSCRPSHTHPLCLTYQRGVHMSTITCSSIMPGISKRSAHVDHHMLIHHA